MRKVLLVLCLLVIIIPVVNSSSFAFTLSTGSKKGVYFNVAAKEIKRQIDGKFVVDIVTSKGSVENIARLKSGEADGAIVQFDSLITEGKGLDLVMVSMLYNEYVHLVTRGESKFDSIKDFDVNNKIAIGRVGSGTQVTWSAFCSEDESYKQIPTDILSGSRAYAALESGDVDGVLSVIGLGSIDIHKIGKKGIFKLANVDDYDFNDTKYKGKRVYEFIDIDKDIYPTMFSGFFNRSIETISVPAVLIVSSKWADEYPDEFDVLYDACTRAVPNILQQTSN